MGVESSLVDSLGKGCSAIEKAKSRLVLLKDPCCS